MKKKCIYVKQTLSTRPSPYYDIYKNVSRTPTYGYVTVQFGEIQKFSRLAEQADESNNKYAVKCIFVQKSRHNYTL